MKLIFDFSSINMADKTINFGIAIVQAIIIALITGLVLNNVFQRERAIGKGFSKYGIKSIKNSSGTISLNDTRVLFADGKDFQVPYELNLCFISGSNFFNDYYDRIKSLVERGCRVKILLGNPRISGIPESYRENPKEHVNEYFEYYWDIIKNRKPALCFQERNYVMLVTPKIKRCGKDDESMKKALLTILQREGDHIDQVREVSERLKSINTKSNGLGKIDIRYYQDEYQIPIILACFNAIQSEKAKMLLWTNFKAPVRETMESINVHAMMIEGEKNRFVDDVKKSFDYLWETYDIESNNKFGSQQKTCQLRTTE